MATKTVLEEKVDKTTKDLGNGFIEVTGSVKDGDKWVQLTYSVPTFGSFYEWASKLPEKSEDPKVMTQERVYDLFVYATDLKERAALRESQAAESTIIMVNGQPVDLMKLSDLKAVQAVNAAFMWAATTGKDPAKAAVVTRGKLLEAKRAIEGDGGLLKVATPA